MWPKKVSVTPFCPFPLPPLYLTRKTEPPADEWSSMFCTKLTMHNCKPSQPFQYIYIYINYIYRWLLASYSKNKSSTHPSQVSNVKSNPLSWIWSGITSWTIWMWTKFSLQSAAIYRKIKLFFLQCKFKSHLHRQIQYLWQLSSF